MPTAVIATRRPSSSTTLPVLAALWALVLLIELTDIPNESLLVYVVPVAELAIWLVAISITLRVLWQLTHGAWRVIALCAIGPTLILALVWFANWSVFEPRSYFQLHRPGFTAIAQMVDNSGFPSPRTYYGTRVSPASWCRSRPVQP